MLAKEEIKKQVPEWVVKRTQENLDDYRMGLYDAFEEAVRNLPTLKNYPELYAAWYHSDFGEYIPGALIKA